MSARNESSGATATTLVIQPTGADTDGDSLPDAWETQFGLDPNAVSANSLLALYMAIELQSWQMRFKEADARMPPI